jgi:hypothetical protein
MPTEVAIPSTTVSMYPPTAKRYWITLQVKADRRADVARRRLAQLTKSDRGKVTQENGVQPCGQVRFVSADQMLW